MTSKRLAGIVACVVLATGFAIAQGPNRDIGRNVPLGPEPAPNALDIDDRFALSIDVEVHNIDVVVTDNDGNPLTDSRRDTSGCSSTT